MVYKSLLVSSFLKRILKLRNLYQMALLLLISIALLSISILFKLLKKGSGPNNLPKGSLGYPLIGETLSFLQAQKIDQGPEWIQKRVQKYGPVFKTSLMGSPTVVIVGQAGNKFILGSDEDVLVAKQPKTLTVIGGKENIFELSGLRYKLVKGAIVNFMKPESLQNNITKMDGFVKNLFLNATKNQDRTILPTVDFMKRLTFDIACNILFGIKDEEVKKAFHKEFAIAFKAIWSLPLDLPGLTYWKGLRARARIHDRVLPIIQKRKEELSEGITKPTTDVLSSLLAVKAEHEDEINDEMIVDNFLTLMIAGHDTSAILLSLMVWKMSKDPQIYHKVLEEQVGIQKAREAREGQNLTWADVQKMKYTWRVAQELMRIIPPVFGSFRKAVKDTSFGGYDIPKGWQVFWSANDTHMSEEIFENPREFNPSRFESSAKVIPPYAYIPFGGGIHSCIGNEFARVETLITIHRLVTMYEWSLVHADEVITRQPMPYPSMGLPIMIKPRMN